MKKIYLILIAAGLSASALAQSAYEGFYSYKKNSQPAAKIELPYPTAQVEDGLKEYMGKKGYKASKERGMLVFRRVALDTSTTDLFFDLERRGRGDGQTTTITLVPVRANEGLENHKPDDKSLVDPAKAFLTDMVQPMADYNHGVKVTGQTNTLKDARQKLDKLVSQQNSLDKKIKDAETDLAQNKLDQQETATKLQDNAGLDQKATQKAHDKMDKLLNRQTKLQDNIKGWQNDLTKNLSAQDLQKAEVKKQEDALSALQQQQPVSR